MLYVISSELVNTFPKGITITDMISRFALIDFQVVHTSIRFVAYTCRFVAFGMHRNVVKNLIPKPHLEVDLYRRTIQSRSFLAWILLPITFVDIAEFATIRVSLVHVVATAIDRPRRPKIRSLPARVLVVESAALCYLPPEFGWPEVPVFRTVSIIQGVHVND